MGITSYTCDYCGGYYGEVAKKETSGKTTAHHIPANSAINNGLGFIENKKNGDTPAILMDYADHALTQSYQHNNDKYGKVQAELIRNGEIAKAIKMDYDDILNIQVQQRLGEKYNKGLHQAISHLYNLLSDSKEDLLQNHGDICNDVFLKSYDNPESIELVKKLLKSLEG
ncbi:hypothetical protein AGMMS49587_04850 [Spirochaetia bacterium]|nr:hypothetical protein AGMMS49587_04850 [Spirochaetia bacterium]